MISPMVRPCSVPCTVTICRPLTGRDHFTLWMVAGPLACAAGVLGCVVDPPPPPLFPVWWNATIKRKTPPMIAATIAPPAPISAPLIPDLRAALPPRAGAPAPAPAGAAGAGPDPAGWPGSGWAVSGGGGSPTNGCYRVCTHFLPVIFGRQRWSFLASAQRQGSLAPLRVNPAP